MKQKLPMQSESQVKPRVYSYIRFSTPEQKLGDSTRRQMENARNYAENHGCAFDEQLRDEGLSGWSGKHLQKGNLGRFLEKVKNGVVPTGSILFVEDLDRLSRGEMTDALETVVFGLIKHGITIATPSATYDRASLNTGSIFLLIGKLLTANDESQKKSERLGRAWAEKKKQAREGKLIATSRGPHWLKIVDKKWVPIPEAVKTVQMIFKWWPKLGRSRLIVKLNKEAPWSPRGRKLGSEGNGWRMSYVNKIISNRAVLGEYQPFTKRGGGKRTPEGEPIKGYYPSIIAPDVFRAAQEKIQENKKQHHGGRTGGAFNLFKNLAKCAYCGGPMTYRDTGPKPKGGQYLVCDRTQRGLGCSSANVNYSEVQECILSNCAKLNPEAVMPSDNERAQKSEMLRTRIAGAQSEMKSNEEQAANLVEQISRAGSSSMRDRYQKRIEELDIRNSALDVQLEFDAFELRRAERNRASFVEWQNGLEVLKKIIAPKDAIDARLRLHSHLKDFISKVEIFSRGFDSRYEPEETESPNAKGELKPIVSGDDFAEKFEALVDEHGMKLGTKATQRAFITYVLQRRMSKEGRFFRVHFKTGSFKDIVPQGGLASGEKLADLSRGTWKFTTPNLDSLWSDFERSRAEPERGVVRGSRV